MRPGAGRAHGSQVRGVLVLRRGVKRKGRTAQAEGEPGPLRALGLFSGHGPMAHMSLNSCEMLGPSCERKHLD